MVQRSQEYNHLISRYSDYQDNKLTAQDLNNYASPSYSSSFNGSETKSKAYAQAMRKLQEHIRFLEQENARLLEKANDNERRYFQEREINEKKYLEEIKILSENLKKSQERLRELEEEHSGCFRKLITFEDQIKLKESQINHLEIDARNTKDQLLIDNENLKLRIEHLSRQLANSDEKSLLGKIEKYEREKVILQAEIEKLNNWCHQLEKDLKFAQEKSMSEKQVIQMDFQNAESSLLSKNEALLDQIRELEIKNLSISKENSMHIDQIRFLQREIEDLRSGRSLTGRNVSPKPKVTSTTTPKKSVLRTKSVSKGKDLSHSLSSTNFRANRHVNLGCFKRDTSKESIRSGSNSRSVSPKPNNDNDLTRRISRLERELQDLNKDYRHLLHMSNSESSNFGNLKNEISSLALEMERKGDELYQLKKKYKGY